MVFVSEDNLLSAGTMADVASDMYDREFNLGLASNERAMLQQVEGALKRIKKDVYGICLRIHKNRTSLFWEIILLKTEIKPPKLIS